MGWAENVGEKIIIFWNKLCVLKVVIFGTDGVDLLLFRFVVLEYVTSSRIYHICSSFFMDGESTLV